MLPQELREIGPDRIIVMTDNCKPIFADKIKYYDDPVFKARLLPPVVVPSLDMDAFIARSEGRSRMLEDGELASPDALALSVADMPAVTNKTSPIAAETKAMAEWLFSNVQWVKPTEDDVLVNQLEMA